jgi:hypothetical protein
MVKKDVAFNSVAIRLLGAQAQVSEAGNLADLIQ